MSTCEGTYRPFFGLLPKIFPSESISVVCDVDRTGKCALAGTILGYYSGLADQVLVNGTQARLTWEGLRRQGRLAVKARACKASEQLNQVLADTPELLSEEIVGLM